MFILAKRFVVDDQVFSNITRQSSIIRKSVQTLEKIWSRSFEMNEKDFEELKKGLFFAEKQIESLTVRLYTFSLVILKH
jgi:hypothetical protein